MEGFLPISIYGAQNTKTKDLPSANISDQRALLRSVPRDILLKGRIWVFFKVYISRRQILRFSFKFPLNLLQFLLKARSKTKVRCRGFPDSILSRHVLIYVSPSHLQFSVGPNAPQFRRQRLYYTVPVLIGSLKKASTPVTKQQTLNRSG